MTQAPKLDGVLIEWGDRLFYPGNRTVRDRTPRLRDLSRHQHAQALRRRIEDTVARCAPQVMVKVTGGGRGMKAIAAHLRYISKNGQLEMEDGSGRTAQGKYAVADVADEWRYGGSFIDETSPRREAFNIMLSMPAGTDPRFVLRAAREFAQAELADHKYVMVLHEHQANPHVHLSVRAESRHGKRLNPRKADLHRWREVFAEKLRGWGIEAEATRQATRGATRNHPDLWQVKAAQAGRLMMPGPAHRRSATVFASRTDAARAWSEIAAALAKSGDAGDRQLAAAIGGFMRDAGLANGRTPTTPAQEQARQGSVGGRSR